MNRFRRSFRARIAILVALLSGTVLITFGCLLWWHLRQSGLARIDREISEIATQHLDYFLRTALPGRGPATIPPWFYGDEFRDTHVWARTARGTEVHRCEEWPSVLALDDLPAAPPQPALPRGHPTLPDRTRPIAWGSTTSGSRSWRLATVSQDGLNLHVALDLTRFHQRMGRNAGAIGLALTLALGLAGLGGWWLSGRALRPVEAVTRSAEHVTAAGLSERLSEIAQDREFARLVRVYNEMLSRLERSFEQAARFSADAAHELRTPLAIMQGQVESALRQPDLDGPAAEALATQLDEVHRLKGLVHRLLLLSRADRGMLLSGTGPVDLSALARNAAEDAGTLAEDLTHSCEIADEVRVTADRELLELAVGNLISNAAKYNQPGGSVHVALSADEREATLRIANTGPPIEGDDRERIFERFHRSDQARSRKVDGTGLGLSLAREIALSHGGSLELESSDAGTNVFALKLPLRDSA